MRETVTQTSHLRISFMMHLHPNCWSGDYHYSTWWSLWANLEVTVVHKTQLTATLGQLTLCDGLPVPVSLEVSVQACVRCVYVNVLVCTHTHNPSPRERLWPDGVSDGTLITQPSKGGCPGQKWVEDWWLCGGQWGCPWGKKKERDEGAHVETHAQTHPSHR